MGEISWIYASRAIALTGGTDWSLNGGMYRRVAQVAVPPQQNSGIPQIQAINVPGIVGNIAIPASAPYAGQAAGVPVNYNPAGG